MKYLLLLLFSLWLVFSLTGQNRFSKDGVTLSIQASTENKEVLIFTLKNTHSKTLITDQFDCSALNRWTIVSPTGHKMGSSAIRCHNLGYLHLAQEEKKEWELNIKKELNPVIYREEHKYPKGQYEIYWIVNDVQSASFFYEKLYDGVRW